MQTTLLSVGIAIILALLAALVGPFFIEWSDYRSLFEARASRILGVPVSIAGPIDARLLPVPSVTLRDVEVRSSSGASLLKGRELGIEFALGALVRGDWRATEVRLVGPEVSLGLDAKGRIDWIAAAGGDPDALSIDRLSVEDGRIVLADAASATRRVLDRFWFNGDLRSLAGPLKGDGGFFVGDERYGYRVTTGRLGEDGVRLRIVLDPADQPLSADADGMLRLENGTPRFEGALTLARLPAVALAQGRAINSEPWRLTGRVKATSAGALFEQLDLQYGPEERVLKLAGAAELKFGRRPRLDAVVSARQLDIDRLAALPEETRRLPLAVIRSVAEALGGTLRPGIPARLGIGIDTLTVAGGSVQGLRGDLVADAGGWEIESLEFRAPGFAQVRMSGRLAFAGEGAAFSGPASIDATDPRTLVAWLEGRSSGNAASSGPLRASGDVTVGSDRIAVERLKAEIDRKAVAGRFAYSSAGGQRPKLDAEINAAELDLDAATALLKSAVPGLSLDVPAELTLALDIGRATLGGVEARNAKARIKLDPDGLVIERLALGDLAGAGVELTGRIEGPWATPRGALTLDLSGSRLDGVLAVLEKAAPQLAEPIRAASRQLVPFKLRMVLALDRAAQSSTAKARIDGTAGPLRVALGGDFAGDPAAWRASESKIEGSLEADDGRLLAALFGIEKTATVSAGPGALRVTATGRLDGEMRAQGRLAANGLDLNANGVLRLGEDGIAGQASVGMTVADAVLLRQPAGRIGQPAPLGFRARLAFTPARLDFEDLTGTLAGTTFNGRLALTLSRPLQLEGRLDADVINGSLALFGALLGMPAVGSGRPDAASIWSSQPFVSRFLADTEGRVALRASRAMLTPSAEIRQLQALLRFARNEVAIEDLSGVLAGGRLSAHVTLPRGPEGTSIDARLAIAGADIAALLPSETRAPIAGRVSLQIEAKGTGRSPAALAGALGGAGTISVEGVELTGLDPRVFEAVTRAVDQGMSVDGTRIGRLVETSLQNGRLRIASADGTLGITAGQLRLGGLLARGDRADLGVSASIDLAQWVLDARLALQGSGGADGPAAGRPEVHVALKGPVAAPKRSIDVSALVGWLTLRSVELQARKLEALETERRTVEAARAAETARAAEAAKIPARIPARGGEPGAAGASRGPETTATPAAAAPPPPAAAPPQAAPPLVVAPLDAVGSAPATETTLPNATHSPQGVPRSALPESPESAPAASTPNPLPRLRRSALPFGAPASNAPSPAPSDATAPPAAMVPSNAGSTARRQALPSAFERAPDLPPPVDIRPAPGQRRVGAQQPAPPQAAPQQRQATGSSTGSSSASELRLRPPATVPPEARQRGFLDLFGPAR